MVKCRDCRKEMVFRQLPDGAIILVCPDPQCNFQSDPISIDNASQDDNPLKIPEGNHSHPDDGVLRRKGPIDEFLIFCIDASSRMDVDVHSNEQFEGEIKNKIQSNSHFTDELKEKLLDLLMPPISFFRATVLSLALFLVDNLEKMTHGPFKSFQVVTMAGEVDEVFRFPNFKEQATFNIVIELIDILFIKRKEYRNGDLLSFRSILGGMNKISELIHELRDIAPDQEVNITLVTIGEHRMPDNQFINPLRSCKNFLGDLGPFVVNVLDLNIAGREKIYKPLTKEYHGTYSKETTLKAIYNAIVFQKYNSDPVKNVVHLRRLEMAVKEKRLTRVEKQPPKSAPRTPPLQAVKPVHAPLSIPRDQHLKLPKHDRKPQPDLESMPASKPVLIPLQRQPVSNDGGKTFHAVNKPSRGKIEELTIPRGLNKTAEKRPPHSFTFITKPSTTTFPSKAHPSLSPARHLAPQRVDVPVSKPLIPVEWSLGEENSNRTELYKDLGIDGTRAGEPVEEVEKTPEIKTELFDIGTDYFQEKEEDIKVSKPESSGIILHRGVDDIMDKIIKKKHPIKKE
ncbi:MAG: hypothetical protein ACTSUE_25075 [Promethearchaeota archaeon]